MSLIWNAEWASSNRFGARYRFLGLMQAFPFGKLCREAALIAQASHCSRQAAMRLQRPVRPSVELSISSTMALHLERCACSTGYWLSRILYVQLLSPIPVASFVRWA